MPGRSSRCYGTPGKCEKIPLSGFPLGIFEEATYDERSYILDPGDVSCSIPTASPTRRIRSGEFFGHKRVAEIITEHAALTADAIADHMLEEVDRFSGGQHPTDDRTLLVLKVR